MIFSTCIKKDLLDFLNLRIRGSEKSEGGELHISNRNLPKTMQKCPGSENFPRNYSHWCSTVGVESVKISDGMIIGQGKMWIYRVDPNTLGTMYIVLFITILARWKCCF